MGLRTTGTVTIDASATVDVGVNPDGKDLMAVLVETSGPLIFRDWVFGRSIPVLTDPRNSAGARGFFLPAAAGSTVTEGTLVNGELFLSFAPIPLIRNPGPAKFQVVEAAAVASKYWSVHALFTDSPGNYTKETAREEINVGRRVA